MYQVEKYNYNTHLKPIHQQQHQYQTIRVYQTQQPIYNYNIKAYNINNRNKIIRKQILINRPLEVKDKSSSTNSEITASSTVNSNNNNSSKITTTEKCDSDKRLKHNRDVLYYLNAGDIIEKIMKYGMKTIVYGVFMLEMATLSALINLLVKS